MVILGIDPALAITGFGVIRIHKEQVFLQEAGIISTSVSQPKAKRLEKIHQAMEDLIADNSPDVVVLEKLYAHYRHPTTASLLGHARGVIILACAEANLPVVEYAATRVKKSIVGKGLASKAQVQRMIVNSLSLPTTPKYTDVTDALALAIAHSQILKADNKLTPERSEGR